MLTAREIIRALLEITNHATWPQVDRKNAELIVGTCKTAEEFLQQEEIKGTDDDQRKDFIRE